MLPLKAISNSRGTSSLAFGTRHVLPSGLLSMYMGLPFWQGLCVVEECHASISHANRPSRWHQVRSPFLMRMCVRRGLGVVQRLTSRMCESQLQTGNDANIRPNASSNRESALPLTWKQEKARWSVKVKKKKGLALSMLLEGWFFLISEGIKEVFW